MTAQIKQCNVEYKYRVLFFTFDHRIDMTKESLVTLKFNHKKIR